VYTYTGAGHGGGDTNLYFYLPPSVLPAPDAPAGLTASALSSSQIRLTWIDNSSGEQGFKIERCAGVGCTDFAQVVMVGANATSYTNTGLTASTSYSYRVRAFNASGDSGYSNIVGAMTQPAPAPPAAPSNLTTAAISRNRIDLAWTDNANSEVGFRIERCRGSICTNFALIATVGSNVTSYRSSGLAANTTYRYRVHAFNASGTSGYSNISAATTRRR
jgi:predicted phage tail protein